MFANADIIDQPLVRGYAKQVINLGIGDHAFSHITACVENFGNTRHNYFWHSAYYLRNLIESGTNYDATVHT
jgi:hypothetical protein